MRWEAPRLFESLHGRGLRCGRTIPLRPAARNRWQAAILPKEASASPISKELQHLHPWHASPRLLVLLPSLPIPALIPACSPYLRPACSPTSRPTALVAAMPPRSSNLSAAGPPSSLCLLPQPLWSPLSPNRSEVTLRSKTGTGTGKENAEVLQTCLRACPVLGLCPDCGRRGRFRPRRQAACIFLPGSTNGVIAVARGGVVGRSREGRRRRWCCPASIFAKHCCCCYGIWLFVQC
jgi:hypothetical protein